MELGGSILLQPPETGIPFFVLSQIDAIPIILQKSDIVIPICHEGNNRSQIMLQAVRAIFRANFDITQNEPICVFPKEMYDVDLPWNREWI